MAKGRFSKSRSRDEDTPEEHSRFYRSEDMEATSPLPDIPEDPDREPEQEVYSEEEFSDPGKDPEHINISMMPEVDFHNLTDDTFSELPWDQFPELGSLELDRDDAPPLPRRARPTEEEAIEEAFQQVVEEKPRPASPGRMSRFWAARRKPILIGSSLAVLAIVLILAVSVLIPQISDPYNHQILNGVVISGVDVGGMSRKQAEETLSKAVTPVLSSQPFILNLPEGSLTLYPADTEIQMDVPAAVKEAYRYGRSGSKADKEEAYRQSLTETFHLDPVPFLRMNKNYVKGQLKTYTLEHESVFMPSSYALEGEQPPLDLPHYNENNTCQTLLLSPGNPGIELNFDQICDQVLAAYGTLSMTLSITAEQAGTLPEPLDLEKILEEVSIAPVDSAMDPDTYEVISGSYGYTFDMETAQRLLRKANYGEVARVPMQYTAPAVTDDGVLFRDVLGEAETPHGSNPNRNTNLRLACEALNGVILYPGDELSYNETLGQRTADKGYKPAPAYSGNTLVDSIGGGICQVSSTLYYAAMLADMKITDRINHGFLPSYIEPGMDATVSWGKPDFKFKNSSDLPIQISAVATDDAVKIQILGTDNRDYYVKMEYTDTVSKRDTVYKPYPAGDGYEDGEEIQGGNDGHYVITYRCKYRKDTDELISREQEARSSYPAHDRIIASVDTPEVPEPPVTQPQPPETEAPQETNPPTVPPQTEPVQPPTEAAPEANSGGSDAGNSEVLPEVDSDSVAP